MSHFLFAVDKFSLHLHSWYANVCVVESQKFQFHRQLNKMKIGHHITQFMSAEIKEMHV